MPTFKNMIITQELVWSSFDVWREMFGWLKTNMQPLEPSDEEAINFRAESLPKEFCQISTAYNCAYGPL